MHATDNCINQKNEKTIFFNSIMYRVKLVFLKTLIKI